MSSIKDRLQKNLKIDSVDFVNFDKIDCEVEFKEPISVMEILNPRVEEFVTITYYDKRLFVMGFMGMTCIVRELQTDTVGNVGNHCFSFSVRRDLLKILDKKEDLKFNLSNGMLNWTFKYGEGYIAKTVRPTTSIYEVKKYLDFVLNYSIGNKEGKIKIKDVKRIHKLLTKVEQDPMSRNIVLGNGYMYAVLPSYAIYKPTGVKSNTLLTENIISNLPKSDDEYEICSYKGFSGLLNPKNNTYFIFKNMQSKDLIEPYTKLKINWAGNIGTVNSAIKVLTFGDKSKDVKIVFNENPNTVTIKDMDNENNKFVAFTEVRRNWTVIMNSVIQDFSELNMIGCVDERGKEHIKALSFLEGEICLLR